MHTGNRLLMAVVAAGAALAYHPVFAGVPFLTDDPEVVEPHHVEINTAAEGLIRHDAHSGRLPGVEINYGVVDNLQASINFGMAFMSATGEKLHYGFGDTEIALKYRFIQEDEKGLRPQVAFAPAVTFATGNDHLGLGDGHHHVTLPLWVQKTIGPWTTFGGGGYVLNYGARHKSYWIAGWAVQRKVTEKLQLGGELFRSGAASDEDPTFFGFNVGGTYALTDHSRILLSVGRGLTHVRETNQFSYYAGYQIEF